MNEQVVPGPAPSRALSPASDAAGAQPLAERARVLVVDDDERNLLAISTVIEDLAEIAVARSGEEALRHLLKGEFAVILLDVYMPGMDGYETAQLARSREQTKRIPIIFLSAVNKEADHLMRGYSMGAVDYVFKPVDAVVLRSKVSVFVDLFLMQKEVERKARHEQLLLDANLRANAERLRIERELRLAAQHQAALLSSLPIMLFLEPLGEETRSPRFVSGNAEALTGFALDELRAAPALWAERLHPEDRERVLTAFARRSKGSALSIEYRWGHADGAYRHFLDRTVPLESAAGEPVEYAGTLLDMTDRKELESQLVHARKMDSIGQLTGGIAHDFNNLLAAVIGGLGLLERRVPLEEEHRRIIGLTRHAAEQGTELVKRLLAFARKQQLRPAAIDLATLAAGVTQLLSHTLGGLVELEWRLAPGLWCPFADEAQLELALMNLIINARDACPDGGVITVSAENREVKAAAGLAPGSYVVLSVADTGCGIAPHLVDQVMEPFFTTKEVGKGTGLGLSMVYGFVTQSGGTLRLTSALGAGTKVEMWLPRTSAAQGAPVVAAVEPGSAGMEEGAPLRILLVDDHDGVRATTMALLQDSGHRVVEAADVQAALELLLADPAGVDLIVTDYAMPRQSGLELIRQARRLRPGIPAIVITGYAETAALRGDVEDVRLVAKPFEPAILLEAIRAVTCASRPSDPPIVLDETAAVARASGQ